ncbi:Arc family DNA-binding protein [Stenotrophomonas sp. NPDC077421]|uniref:Arc family DNA-binding protein n=1 Tax=Stenotrophomonas sp. NPDC077421 TaxID=3414699 RepID=UPI0012D09813|nr:Arc family DNA-binding protein [Stenotrophomonas sp.]
MARTDPQVNVRMPADLKSELEGAASASGRSLTAEIVTRLEWSLESQLLDQVHLLHKNLGEVRNLAADLDGLTADIKRYEAGQREALRWLLEDEAIPEDRALAAARLARDTMNERLYALRYSIQTILEAIEKDGREPAYYRRKF